jgi:hypothetical protein
MVIALPVCPEVLLNEVMPGAGMKVKPAIVSCPFGVTTLTSPVEPLPTVAVI